MGLVDMIEDLRNERRTCADRISQIDYTLREAAAALGVGAQQAPARAQSRVPPDFEEAVAAVRMLESWVGHYQLPQEPQLQVLECMPPVFQLSDRDTSIAMSGPCAERVAVALLVKAIEVRSEMEMATRWSMGEAK